MSMDSRQQSAPRWLGAAATILLVLGGCSRPATSVAATGGASHPATAQRPNIVFILADDLDMSLYSDTAGLAELLEHDGMKFTNNYVSLPLCCPSRTTILRGQYGHNTGLMTNDAPEGGFSKAFDTGLEKSTVATWLQGAGYRTALIGKYLNGYGKTPESQSYIPPGWNTWISPNGGNAYKQFRYTMNENGKTVRYGTAPEDYNTDVLAAKAKTFIQENSGKPYFLYLATYTPHAPATVAPRYAQGAGKAARSANVDMGRSFNEADVSDKPAWVRERSEYKPKVVAHMQQVEAKRRLSMLAVVDLVRGVIDTLKSTSQLDRTYVIFASDNGLHRGQHRLASGKDTPYETDVHLPLIVRGPGIHPGSTSDALIVNADFAPTFAELAGASVPDFVDGRSFVSLLKGAQPPVWRNAVLLEHGAISKGPPGDGEDGLEPGEEDAPAGESAAPVYAGLRTKKHAYVEYDDGERELYDMTRDPDQLDNIYAKADPTLKKSLSTMLASLRHARGEALRQAEQQPLP